MHKYKEADLKYDLARGLLEWSNSKTSDTKSNKNRNNKQTEHDGDDGDTKLNKRRKMCIDCNKTENELKVKHERDYPPVTEMIVKKQKILHTTRGKRNRNGEVYRNNRQKKKKIVLN